MLAGGVGSILIQLGSSAHGTDRGCDRVTARDCGMGDTDGRSPCNRSHQTAGRPGQRTRRASGEIYRQPDSDRAQLRTTGRSFGPRGKVRSHRRPERARCGAAQAEGSVAPLGVHVCALDVANAGHGRAGTPADPCSDLVDRANCARRKRRPSAPSTSRT